MSRPGGYSWCHDWCGSGKCHKCGWNSAVNDSITEAPKTKKKAVKGRQKQKQRSSTKIPLWFWLLFVIGIIYIVN